MIESQIESLNFTGGGREQGQAALDSFSAWKTGGIGTV